MLEALILLPGLALLGLALAVAEAVRWWRERRETRRRYYR